MVSSSTYLQMTRKIMTLKTYTATSKHAANGSNKTVAGTIPSPLLTSSLRLLGILFTILVVVYSVSASLCLSPSSISTLIRHKRICLSNDQWQHMYRGCLRIETLIILDAGSIGSRIHVYEFKWGQAESADDQSHSVS